jgi:hypothetical protein
MATQPTTNDPFEAMNDPQVRAGGNSDYFGQIKIDSFFAVLVKGTGKVPFDPNQHSMDKRVTSIDMVMFPLAEMNISWDVNRNCIAESREWAGIVLPSIKALGLTPRDLNNKWVHMQRKETGDTYVSKKDGKSYPVTTFEFIAVYPDEAACRVAYQQFSSGAGTAPQATPAPAPAATPTNGNGSSKERDAALKFLKVVVENGVRGQSDLNVIRNTVAANLAQMPAIGKFFTVDSPETMNLIAELMPK